MYDLKIKLDEYRVYWEREIDELSKAYFKPTKKQGNMDFGILNSCIDPSVERYKKLKKAEQDEFKSTLIKFIRTYSFISSIVKLDDANMHKLYVFSQFLSKKLPKDDTASSLSFDNEITLQYYRVQKIFEGSITLDKSEPLSNKHHVGVSKGDEEKSVLSELIEKLNERFGTEFNNIDKVLEQFINDMDNNEELRMQARSNSEEHFRFPFDEVFTNVVIDRMNQNQSFCEKVLDDEKFSETIRGLLVNVVYEKLRQTV